MLVNLGKKRKLLLEENGHKKIFYETQPTTTLWNNTENQQGWVMAGIRGPGLRNSM